MVSSECQRSPYTGPLHAERVVGDYMNRCLLRGSATAVDANVLGAKIRRRVASILGSPDEPTCPHVSDLVVDRLAGGSGCVTDPITDLFGCDVGNLTGKSPAEGLVCTSFVGSHPQASLPIGRSSGE